MSGRFDYVKYDATATELQESFKRYFELLESAAGCFPDGRSKALYLTALEEAYMWAGKAIRDGQIARDSQTAHVPERG